MNKPERGLSENRSPAMARLWLRRTLWSLWGALEVFLLQNAWASRQEHEPRATLLFSLLFVVFMLGAGIVQFIRRAGLLD